MSGLAYTPDFTWLYGTAPLTECIECQRPMPRQEKLAVARPARKYVDEIPELVQKIGECTPCFRRRFTVFKGLYYFDHTAAYDLEGQRIQRKQAE